MDDYRLLADEVAAAIADGRLRPGQQLPTQRAFARTRGIAASTAGRVYRELARRRLVVGEVGRGTFVRAGRPGAEQPVALAEPAAPDRVDLELNYPVVPEQSALLAAGLAPLLRPDALEAALRPIGVAGTAAARRAFAGLVEAAPQEVLFAGSGRQLLAAALGALVPTGQRLGVEELTYPVVKAVAERLGIALVPLAVDEQGVLPQALAAAHRSAPLRAVYLQPRLHNPLGASLSPERCERLAGELRRLDLPVVEDAIWSFLHPGRPALAALLPERTVLVDSLSKRLAPGLTTGFAVVPDAGLRERLAAALRSGGWAPSGFALEAAVRWVGDGTVAAVEGAKRADATERQLVARRLLAGRAVRSDPVSYYLWWELPRAWRAETFVAAAARHGIAVTPAAAFAADPRSTPNAVRVGLASPALPVLREALGTLARIAASTPEELW
ncbi:PLP-dependent aminotransferase family protein [Kitasatospora viridis]|uniref:DNA-binding transcriptional MocR family regulator n=1 Tax=Kitasatospora viridis TaxID=281105 RepID=A0A561UQ80_9ACTN|nr:PLP-dependent aminotransferase family protein [Kitasatospora viridis]TWG01518.1 DNA-binding transcriptional MocR family regulator [Kitasatospora viridis]